MALQTDTADQHERAGPDSDKRYLGKYPGLVRDSFDPHERGRVRIYCPDVMGERDDDEHWLDWAEANMPGTGFDQGLMMVPPDPSWERRDVGAGNSPFNDTRVWVEFRDGDPRRPIYSGGNWIGESDLPHSKPKLADSNTGGDETTAAPNRTSATTRTDIIDRNTGETAPGPTVREVQPSSTAQYPYNYVYKSPAGHVIEIDNTPGGERLRVYHPSGTAWEINEAGTLATKIVGKESTFTSGDMQRVVKGSATTIVEGLSHHQYNKSSNWIFGDDVLEVIKKSKKTFLNSGWNIESGGQYRVKAGNIELETVGAIKLIAGAAVNIGTDDFSVTANTLEISALTAKLQGSAICIVKGVFGVQLLGNAVLATEKIYASTAINASLATAASALLTAAGTAGTGLAAAPLVPINILALGAWITAVTTAMSAISTAFNSNLCIHRASIL